MGSIEVQNHIRMADLEQKMRDAHKTAYGSKEKIRPVVIWVNIAFCIVVAMVIGALWYSGLFAAEAKN